MSELTDRRTLQTILKRHGVVPRKHWGQNFLVSRKILLKILDASDIDSGTTVLEVGGGVGTISQELARRAKRLLVIERDPKLCQILEETLASFGNVEIRCEDARTFDPVSLGPTRYTLVANLPYSVGLPILRNLLESEHPPTDCFVMLQREVANRLTAKPPRMTLPGVAMQSLASVDKLFTIPAAATWPEPHVDSTYLKITPHVSSLRDDRARLLGVVKQGFSHPRKKVLKNLGADEKLARTCGFAEAARAQELSLPQWQCVADNLTAR